ncbi:dihydrofolate reductase [Halobacillus karajensis]|uniref:Dihydrofolate reductase n=1 Tax=Halobacillus karajensis TaxID=195088 RepID=A0A024P1V5_9BACI|nr:dihydrofolate reductase [Halobacillus karajensis]CDQ19561.1 Dihydrofolate reductase [Halobacillus karajensis]CDQ22023.1 Dihydrofolate reductase [Halobacillus karajensis]CDQ27864.1 Dihydrofolate reductase [Halobacillus karajensis]
MISFIFAMDKNQLIGKDNDLPWHIPNDFKFFKDKTWGKTIIMGRKTFESFGKPLPERTHIVITSNKNYDRKGCTVIHSIDQILELEKENPEKEWFVIGGSVLFEKMLPYADRMYLTFIDASFEGDTYFPDFDTSEWALLFETKGLKDDRNPYDYYFRTYERKHQS